MTHLQDAFDAMTRLTLNTKRLAKDLIQSKKASAQTKEYSDRGIQLCRALVQPTMDIEELLMTESSMVSEEKAIKTLQASAQPFLALQKFEQELSVLHRGILKGRNK